MAVLKLNGKMVKKWLQLLALEAVHQNALTQHAVKANQLIRFISQAKRNNNKKIYCYDASTLCRLTLALHPTINATMKAIPVSGYSDIFRRGGQSHQQNFHICVT